MAKTKTIMARFGDEDYDLIMSACRRVDEEQSVSAWVRKIVKREARLVMGDGMPAFDTLPDKADDFKKDPVIDPVYKQKVDEMQRQQDLRVLDSLDPKKRKLDLLIKDNPAVKKASDVSDVKWVKADLDTYASIVPKQGCFKSVRGTDICFHLGGEVVGFDYGGGRNYEVLWKGVRYHVSGEFENAEGPIKIEKI